MRSRGELRLKRNVASGERTKEEEDGAERKGGRAGALSRQRGRERGGCSVQHVVALLLQWMASAEGRKEGRKEDVGRK